MVMRRNIWILGVVVLMGLGTMPTAFGQANLTMTLDATHLTIASGDPILRYHYTDVPFKPYVQELYSPRGFNLLLDAPSDHLHHHGLMFAVAANDVDFWAETETCGKQMHRGFTGVSVDEVSGVARATFSEAVDWVRPDDNATLLNEARTIATYRAPDLPATLVTWISALTPAPGLPSVTLTGSHYFGLGFRFPPSMDAIGTFRNSAGDLGHIVRGEERNGRANWSCYTASGRRQTRNRRHVRRPRQRAASGDVVHHAGRLRLYVGDAGFESGTLGHRSGEHIEVALWRRYLGRGTH